MTNNNKQEDKLKKRVSEFFDEAYGEGYKQAVRDVIEAIPEDTDHIPGCYFLDEGSYLKRHCDCGAIATIEYMLNLKQSLKKQFNLEE